MPYQNRECSCSSQAAGHLGDRKMSRQISEGGESSRNRPISGLDRAIRSMLLCLILSVSTQGQSTAGDDEHALGLLHAGNDFATQGLHAEAIAKWSEAAVLRPDSNVPWNNIANALMNLDRQDEALAAAQKAFDIRGDYMSSVTLSNMLKRAKEYGKAEQVLLKGIRDTLEKGHKFEHPFWSLASLYFDQGDIPLFVRYAELGFEMRSPSPCSPTDPTCEVPTFESDTALNLYNVSLQLGSHAAWHQYPSFALANFTRALQLAERYPRLLDPASPARHLACLRCVFPTETRAAPAKDGCERLQDCNAEWGDVDGRYLRMMSYRLMVCDWRSRAEDEADFARVMGAADLEPLLRSEVGWGIECEGGRVCGAGAQPPLHLWGMNMSLHAVLKMGTVQPLQLVTKIAATGPAPGWGYPIWSPSLPFRFHIAYISSDLLRDHPVGNMMRAVLPLHDLSRMEVTLFVIHEHQQHFAAQAEHRHLLGDVKIRMLGRGPHVSEKYDGAISVEGADAINAAGVCILFDLIGYTSDHRQDVLALRPAPVQIHYHGYMGTTGAPWFQGYVADHHIAPPEHAGFFSERLILLPECFLGPSHRLTHQFWGRSAGSKWTEGYDEEDDRTRRVRDKLPPEGPVLCSFNQHFKLEPATFGVWMAMLHAMPGSVLWLLEGNAVSHRNIRREAADAGINSHRIIFAPRVEIAWHLRRASLCDVALDTPQYNSGATGADTLFASVPIVSLPANKPVGRMGASMLSALRLPELIVRTPGEYARVVQALVERNGALQRIRNKLLTRVVWAPLFDVRAWVNDFDQAARMVWDGFVAGEEEGEEGREEGGGEEEREKPRALMNFVVSRPRALY